jgi:hypothetical protein
VQRDGEVENARGEGDAPELSWVSWHHCKGPVAPTKPVMKPMAALDQG